MADSLDSLVKGAPVTIPGQDPAKAAGGTTPIASSDNAPSTPGKPGDPLSHTPSSPSMIYLNLLVLEASLRAQYLELRARRRHHTFFLSLLTLWTAFFGYALFLAPREDGRGIGGSVYWVVETTEHLCFLGGAVTCLLVWVTGIWERGVRWPRRWFAVSNRGLRGFNCKLVVMKRPWWKEALSTIGWFLTYGLFSNNGSSYRWVDPVVLREVDRELHLSKESHPTVHVTNWDEEKGGHEEDLAPGGDYVKLLLLAKPAEYWEKENERRALLRAKLKDHDRNMRRQGSRWSWWLPAQQPEAEKPVVVNDKVHHPRHVAVVSEHRRTRSGSTTMRRGSISTTTGSRSTTPTLEVDEHPGISRKGSLSSNSSEKKRKKPAAGAKARPRVESRSVTPEIPSPLAKESSSVSADVTSP
ncbi:Nem1-Spo7 phosphatase regulatory subunit [Collariella sp. IMI 366227]|nr:Nem1-Spo7 phosphatase regulatory subunit [Collariella sp. IMI 366227]